MTSLEHWIMIATAAFATATGIAVSVAPPANAEDVTTATFRKRCATCHGMDGKGDTTAGQEVGPKDWTDGKTLTSVSNERIRAVIRDGVITEDGKERMPPGKRLSDQEIEDLQRFVRTFQ